MGVGRVCGPGSAPTLCSCCVAHCDVSLYESCCGKSGSTHLADLILWTCYLVDSLNETLRVFSV